MPNEDFPESAWDSNLEVNLNSAMLMNQAAAKLMIAKGYGKIINVASILSFQGGLNVPAYAASKHALVGLTRSCCNAWADKGVNVNAIAPGFIETEMTAVLVTGFTGRPSGARGRTSRRWSIAGYTRIRS